MYWYVIKLLSKYAIQVLLPYHGKINTVLFGFCDTVAPNQKKTIEIIAAVVSNKGKQIYTVNYLPLCNQNRSIYSLKTHLY